MIRLSLLTTWSRRKFSSSALENKCHQWYWSMMIFSKAFHSMANLLSIKHQSALHLFRAHREPQMDCLAGPNLQAQIQRWPFMSSFVEISVNLDSTSKISGKILLRWNSTQRRLSLKIGQSFKSWLMCSKMIEICGLTLSKRTLKEFRRGQYSLLEKYFGATIA